MQKAKECVKKLINIAPNETTFNKIGAIIICLNPMFRVLKNI